ncbi:MAG: hypothetical protein A3J79_10245 [Elusimicrobia bacterium RIFOXYB2_FULL_62_6]|nr:MAG: hypothetical protein A3J79_10245 [Elusimicrobia bacterium RIFOXYB2_FULL_62_6]
MTARNAFLSALLALCPAHALFAGETTVVIKTPDGCALEAFFLAPSSGSFVFINSHGLGSDKNEWRAFDAALGKAGLGYLSLDLRGHGSSLKCGGKRTDYRNFTAEGWQLLSRDIKAAAAFLKTRKIPARKLVLCGASIGANLSVKAASEGTAPAGLVLLSPGRAYAGVTIGDDFFAGHKARFFIAAAPDDPYAWQSSRYLAALLPKDKELRGIFRAGPSGHGVNMFSAPGSSLIGDILEWVKRLPK